MPSRLEIARKRLALAAITTAAVFAAGVAWGLLFNESMLPVITSIVSLGFGFPLIIVLWMDFVRVAPSASGRNSKFFGLSFVAIRLFGLLTAFVGCAIFIWLILTMIRPQLYQGTLRQRLLSTVVALSLIMVGLRWLVWPKRGGNPLR